MSNAICIECHEAITNPICAQCLAGSMREMVGAYDEDLAKQIQGFTIEGDTCCISCNKAMSRCAHCFSRDIYDYLLEHNETIAKEFIGRFDFDLRRSLLTADT